MADKKIGEYYAPPPKMGKWEGFKKFLWNSETSQCLGRTGSSWGKYTIHIHLSITNVYVHHHAIQVGKHSTSCVYMCHLPPPTFPFYPFWQRINQIAHTPRLPAVNYYVFLSLYIILGDIQGHVCWHVSNFSKWIQISHSFYYIYIKSFDKWNHY